MKLSGRHKKHLKSLGHQLRPVVRVGQKGITDAVREELDGALAHHELVKIKVGIGDRHLRSSAVRQLADATRADLIQSIGQVAILYSRNVKSPVIHFPK